MRLAQLARKIAVKPSEIASYLASQQIIIEDSSNAKIEDAHERLVLAHFAPELLAPEVESDSEVSLAEASQSREPENVIPDQQPEVKEEHSEIKENEVSEVEVIKPQKVELPGLKVVGKIDLPEPKKKVVEEAKQEETVAEGDAAEPAPKPIKREPRPNRRQQHTQDTRPRKNPIALQREREEREALRKKIEQEKKDKELRTQRYLKKVSHYTPPVKQVRKKKEDEYEVFEAQKPQPKTVLGKILRWFVSE